MADFPPDADADNSQGCELPSEPESLPSSDTESSSWSSFSSASPSTCASPAARPPAQTASVCRKRPAASAPPGVKKLKKCQASTVQSYPSSALPGPASIEAIFLWARAMLDGLANTLGTTEVCKRLSTVTWHVSSTFTGIGCGEQAVLSLQHHANSFLQRNNMAPSMKVTLGTAADIDAGCQRLLRQTYNHACIFKDVLLWRTADGRFKARADCAVHERQCALPTDAAAPREIHIAGPPCTMFSRAGLRQQQRCPAYKTHKTWLALRQRRAESVIVFENVPDYKVGILQANFGQHYDIKVTTFCSRHVGQGMARRRTWAVLVHKAKAEWRTEESLAQLLQPLMRIPSLTCEDYFYERLPPQELSQALQRTASNYDSVQPQARIIDLSQNPLSGRGRCELVDGSLMTLKTNSSTLFSRKHSRSLSPAEMMTAMAVPTSQTFASLCGGPCLNITGCTHRAVSKMAGNGMQVCAAGAIMLIVAMYVRIK